MVILGFAARRQLFPGQPALGASLLVKSVPYSVIGVLSEKKQNSNYNGPDNDFLFAPYSAVARDFPPPVKKGIVRGLIAATPMVILVCARIEASWQTIAPTTANPNTSRNLPGILNLLPLKLRER